MALIGKFQSLKESDYFAPIAKTLLVIAIIALAILCLFEYKIILHMIIYVARTNPGTYATLLAGITGVGTAWASIAKQRKLSREKNSLEFSVTYKHSTDVRDAWAQIMELKQIADKNEILKYAKPIDKENKTEEEVEEHKEKANSLSIIFNEWERCAGAIRHSIYEDIYLYQIYATTIIGLYSDFAPYLSEKQKNNPRVFSNFIWLCELWTNRRSKELDKTNIREVLKEMKRIHSSIEENIRYINDMNSRNDT